MTTLHARLLLLVDHLAEAAAALRRRLLGARDLAAAPGASLPGGQTHLAVAVLEDGPSAPILRTGTPKHTLWRTVEWRLLREVAAQLPDPVLDLGCGDGTFGALVRHRIAVGLDGDADAVARCDPRVYGETHTADMREPLPVPPGSLAGAFSNSTLEHVTPLAPALRSLAAALQPGATVAITVPHAGFTRAVSRWFGPATAARMNRMLGHHNLWTWERWREELAAAGLEVQSLRGYQSDEAYGWYAARSLFPWNRLDRRQPAWLWRYDEARVRRLVASSLAVREEAETSCVLIVARRAASSGSS